MPLFRGPITSESAAKGFNYTKSLSPRCKEEWWKKNGPFSATAHRFDHSGTGMCDKMGGLGNVTREVRLRSKWYSMCEELVVNYAGVSLTRSRYE
jgi:hypothetical protein